MQWCYVSGAMHWCYVSAVHVMISAKRLVRPIRVAAPLVMAMQRLPKKGSRSAGDGRYLCCAIKQDDTQLGTAP